MLLLGLAAMAPLPLSVCAVLAAVPGECAVAGAPADCARMGMARSDAPLFAPSQQPCCRLTSAPLSEAQGKAAAPQPAADAALSDPSATLSVRPLRPAVPVISFSGSPPDLQPLLCVFLI